MLLELTVWAGRFVGNPATFSPIPVVFEVSSHFFYHAALTETGFANEAMDASLSIHQILDAFLKRIHFCAPTNQRCLQALYASQPSGSSLSGQDSVGGGSAPVCL